MNILKAHLFGRKKKCYRVELPIGLELSDGDRAMIYGWPDKYTSEVGIENERDSNDTRI